MVDDGFFANQGDYEVPLLRLLYKLPHGQGKAGEVCDLFEAEHGHRIPEEHRHRRASWSQEPVWKNNVRRCRQDLKGRGFLDAPQTGIWRITDTGRRWVEENPNAARIKGVRKQSSQGYRGRSSRVASVPGITLEMLEQTRKAMPADQFREVWGALHDQLLAEERAKAITSVTQTELGRRARRQLDKIHDFLQAGLWPFLIGGIG